MRSSQRCEHVHGETGLSCQHTSRTPRDLVQPHSYPPATRSRASARDGWKVYGRQAEGPAGGMTPRGCVASSPLHDCTHRRHAYAGRSGTDTQDHAIEGSSPQWWYRWTISARSCPFGSRYTWATLKHTFRLHCAPCPSLRENVLGSPSKEWFFSMPVLLGTEAQILLVRLGGSGSGSYKIYYIKTVWSI